MTQVGEAIARFHKLLESDSYKDLGWVTALHESMAAHDLIVSGKPISPFLRPHFLTERQYTTLVKAAELVTSSILRIKQMALQNQALLTRMELLPAEKMLAAVDPGYSHLAVASQLETQLHNGTLRFSRYSADIPTGIVYGEAMASVFYDSPLVKEFRKRYSLTKMHGEKYLLAAMLKSFKEFGGKKQPRIAVLEFRQPFQTSESHENLLLRDYFRAHGHTAEVAAPEQLEYRNGILRKGDFTIDLIFRRLGVHEFLVRYDLSHPLVRAYREGTVCVINSFRSELAQKRSLFDLLTDETITASFPAAERKAIREHIPWTRVVTTNHATYQGETIDLIDYIVKNRAGLVLRPNDDSGEQQTFEGAALNDPAWERAIKMALRSPYVVQETSPAVTGQFPVYHFDRMQMREMRIDVHTHTFLGKVHGCSANLSPISSQGFSTVAGLAPTFIIDSK